MLKRPRIAAPLRLTSLPHSADRDEYSLAADEIEDRLCRLPGVVATYRAGSVGCPGISDLDVVAVVEQGARLEPIWPRLSPRIRYLAMHGPFVADMESFRRHRSFAYLEPLTHSRGAQVVVEEREVPELSEPLLGAESLVNAALRLFKQASTGAMKVRPLLCELNNLRHALSLARVTRTDAPDAWRVADDVTELRNGWFAPSGGEDRLARLRQVVGPALPAVLSALAAVGARAPQTGSLGALPLRAPWSNVALSPTDGERDDAWLEGASRARSLASRSRRLSELRWRSTEHVLPIPAGVMALLRGAGPAEVVAFRVRRDESVRRYGRFMAEAGASYSALGLAGIFVPE